jgi:DNA-binding IclR family transcriptional regulator
MAVSVSGASGRFTARAAAAAAPDVATAAERLALLFA